MDKAHATDESRAAFEALANLRSRRNVLFLQEFLDNPKVKLQEALIPHLVFDPAAYPDGMDHLVEAAIRKVRDSESSYIQHRGDIQITAPSDVSHVQVEFDTDST